MTEDSPANTPVTEKPPENAAVVGSPAVPQDELNKLTDDIVAALKTVYDPEFQPISTSWVSSTRSISATIEG